MVEDLFQMGAQTLLKLHSKKLINPAPEIVKDMKLSPREKVYLFEGIRHLVNEHKAFFRAYVPEEIGEKIKLSDPDSPLLIERVEREILERVKRGRQIISASMADHHLAHIMGVKKGASLLVVKRIYFSRSGRALEMAVTHFPGDVYQGVAELVRVNT